MATAAIAGGVELDYEITGEGEPLLLIMGTGGTVPLWAPTLPALAATHRVITFDNRGFGASTRGEGEIDMRLLADDAAGLLDALEVERAHVLGWSLGSATSQELAINHPDKVASL